MTEIDVLLEDFNAELKEIKDKYELLINKKNKELNVDEIKAKNLIKKMGEDFYLISTELIENVNKKELAEQRLAESEENLRFITENVNDIIIILNKDLRVEYVNELPLNRIGGYQSDDLIEKNATDYIHPDDLDKALKVFNKSFKTGGATIELRLKHKNGHYVWTEARGNMILDDETPKAHIIVRDITQRKIAEEKLRDSEERLILANLELKKQVENRSVKLNESEEKYRQLFKNSPNMIILIDSNGIIIDVNNSFITVLGGKKEDLIGKDFKNIKEFDIRNLTLLKNKFSEAIKHNKIEPFEIQAYGMNGELKWVNIQVFSINLATKKLLEVIIQDIDERKRAKRQLKESEEKYRLITENANDLMVIVNKNFKIEWMNENVHQRLRGFSSKDKVGKNGLNFIHPDDIVDAIKTFKKGFDEGEGMGITRVINKQGDYDWFEIKGKAFIDKDGKKKAILISREITERILYEQKLKESEEKFRTMTENLLVGITLLQGNQIKYINRKNANMLGYNVKELIQRDYSIMLKHIFNEDVPKIIDLVKNVAHNPKVSKNKIEIRAVTKTGQIIWLENFYAQIEYDGKRAQLITSADITERKLAEHKLKESEERYRSLFENMNAGFAYHEVITDDNNKPIDYRYIQVNPAFEKLTGLKADDMIGKNVTEILPGTENDPADWIGKFGNIGLTGIPLIVEDYSDAIDKWFKVSGYSPKKGFFAVTFTDITERKKAEHKLKESEEKYRNLFENSPIMILLIDLSGNIVDVNNPFVNIFGLEKQTLIGKKFNRMENLLPKNRDLFTEKFKEVIKKGSIEPFEVQVFVNEKTIKWMNLQAFLSEVEGKKLIQVILQDINERKEAEQKLKESEERFRTLFEAAPASIMVADLDSNILMCNEKFCKLHGFEDPELVIGRKFPEFIAKEDRLKLSEGVKMTLEGSSRETIPYTMLKNDGTEFPAKATSSAINDKDGNIIGIIGVTQDITKRKKAEQIVKESEEKFRTIAEQSFMGVIILQDEKLKYINEAAAKIFEYSSEEVMNWSKDYIVEKGIHPEDLSILREKRELRRRGEFNLKPYISYRVITRSGKIKWIDQFSRIIDYQGKEAELISIIDISDQKEAEKIITEENKMLVELDQMRKELITRVSHELKTPLVSIFSCSELLIDYYKEQMSEEVMKFVEMIHRGGKRLKDLIKNLLDASQIDAGKLKIKKEKANLIELIRNCIDYVKFLVDDRKISLDYDFPQELFIDVDKIRIEQVFTNLLSNALKNTPSNGNIYLNITEEDNHIYTTIKDTGVGFTKKEMNKIFKKFGKIERYGKELDVDIEGSGLGLYISKEIVGLHGGMIWVESEGRNKGATFTIKLPTRK